MKFLILSFIYFSYLSFANAGNKPTLFECIRSFEGLPTYTAKDGRTKSRPKTEEEEILIKMMDYKAEVKKHNRRFIRIEPVNGVFFGIAEVRDKDLNSVKLEITNILTSEVKTIKFSESNVIDVVLLEDSSVIGIRKVGPNTEVFVKLNDLDLVERFTIENQHLDAIDILQIKKNKILLAGLTKEREIIIETENSKEIEKEKVHPQLFLIEIDFKKDQMIVGQSTFKHTLLSYFFPLSAKKKITLGTAVYSYIEIDGQIHFIDPKDHFIGSFTHESLMGIKN